MSHPFCPRFTILAVAFSLAGCYTALKVTPPRDGSTADVPLLVDVSQPGVDAPATDKGDLSSQDGDAVALPEGSIDVAVFIDSPPSTGGGAGNGGVDALDSMGAGGNSGSGGLVGTGGTIHAGGANGTGGTVATGGLATGGATAAGGATGTGGGGGICGSRDCTSAKDNDCNGIADNQEAACNVCTVGNSRTCSTGGLGICAAGSQTCQLAADHQSVGWGSCLQNVAKRSRDCTSSSDNDCNGQADNAESTFCQCSAADSPRSCSTGLSGICSAGSQMCVLSGDKSSSAWGACTQLKAKGTETCANPGTDDDCNGIVDDVPVTSCNVGTGLGACANGGYTACSGLTPVCNAAVSGIGDATIWHTRPAPNGSWDWDCDGVVAKEYPDTAPSPPTCSGLDISVCGSQQQVVFALNPIACGDLGDIGSLYCGWMSVIPACVNKSGQSTGYQQGCR
jgi:hypothetical protein